MLIIPFHHIWAFVLPIKKSVVKPIIMFLKVISFWNFFKIFSVSHCNRSICRTSFYSSCLGFTGVPQTLDWHLSWLMGNDWPSSLQILPQKPLSDLCWTFSFQPPYLFISLLFHILISLCFPVGKFLGLPFVLLTFISCV